MQDGTGRGRDIGYQIGKLTEAVESIEHRLFGNGQEGIIAAHARDINLLKQGLLEANIRKRFTIWAFRVVGGLLAWSWGALMGSSGWLQAILKALGW